jgi:hypothetical protein
VSVDARIAHDDVTVVYDWVRSVTTDLAHAERLTAQILARARAALPAWIDRLPVVDRLRVLTVSVLITASAV